MDYNEEPSCVAFMHQNINFAILELRENNIDIPGVAAHGLLSILFLLSRLRT